MSKMGFISDLHLDINKISDEEAKLTLLAVINHQKLDSLVLVGDIYNNFQRTQSLVERLNQAHSANVYFLSGNHDMARGIDEVSIEESHPNYLHKQWVDLPDSDVRVIGHNGWYDYTWAPEVSDEKAWTFHQGLSFDRVIPQTGNDIERTDRALVEIDQMFEQARLDKKQVVFATHFVPINDDLYAGNDERIRLINTIMGSKRVGELLQEQNNLLSVVFGHQHINPPIRFYDDIPYVNVAVGINRRRQEWLETTFLATIEEKIYIFAK